MANVFLNGADRDVETAIMLEQAIVHDIGNAVAYTDGTRLFINTDDNLFKILPAYDNKMLKWLLWHERYHLELRHHDRYFKYLSEISEAEAEDKFHLTKEEVNIIMDILVHDSLSKMFPELVETAVNNLAQMRNRNSLSYTFKTNTLEEMLDEYSKFKYPEESEHKSPGSDGEDADSEDKDEETNGEDKGEKKEKSHSESDGGEKLDDTKTEETETEENPDAPAPEPEHDKTDWSKLKEIDSKEFITESEADDYIEQINRIKRMKAKLGKLTETVNGLVTSQRHRTYTMPSYIQGGKGVMLKGSKPGRVALALCFDASGSMGSEMETFKEIISKSIPQAMETPTTWFSGGNPSEIARKCNDKDGRNYDYYKGQFKDFMEVYANSGYNDDGDRTIELCFQAEQKGYTPIGVTDGGGQLSWSVDMLKKLQKTVLVGQSEHWLNKCKEVNPRIQIIYTGRR